MRIVDIPRMAGPAFVALAAAGCSSGAVSHAKGSGGGSSVDTSSTSVGAGGSTTTSPTTSSSSLGAGGDFGAGGDVGAGGSSQVTSTGLGGTTGSGGAGGSGPATGAGGSGGVGGAGPVEAGAPDATVSTGDMRSGPFKMLIFSWTTGFHHDSIPQAQQMAKDIGAMNAIQTFTVDIANAQALDPTGSCENDAQMPIAGCNASVSMFTDENLKNYEIVYFANPTGDDFSRSGAVGMTAKAALEKWMNNGGAYIGTHSATDFEKGGNWTFYNDMLGALFDTHDGDGTPGTVVIQDLQVNHPVVRGLMKSYQAQDEWYRQLRNPEGRPGITILAKLAADQRPVTWVHEYAGGGRMVYTIRGHAKSRFSEPYFRQFFLQGVMWATHRLK